MMRGRGARHDLSRAPGRSLALAALCLLLVAANASAAGFGIEPGSFATTLSGTQAGEHADLTTSLTINQEPANDPAGYVKDVALELPPGLIGNPTATPRCNMNDVEKERCPSDTAVGIAHMTIAQPPGFEFAAHATVLVYNIAPYLDEPAAFGFNAANFPVRLDTSVRSGSDYGITTNVTEVTDARPLIATSVTLWGVPADHNGPGPLETTQCPFNEVTEEEECVKYGARGGGVLLPFLSNPTECGIASSSSLAVDSWQVPGIFSLASSTIPAMTGCDALRFEPSISLVPESGAAGQPTGYTVGLHVPNSEDPGGLATPELRNAVVSLPEGVVLSPSAADGLQSCSDAQFGLKSAASASCPKASQIASVRIATPLLSNPLEGQMFLATPLCAPCSAADAQEGRMIRVLLQAAGSGVLVKLQGTVSVDQASGRLTASFQENPQLPFEDLELTINGGPRAPLANPTTCGVPFVATSRLTPFSGETPAEPSSEPFAVTDCPAPRFSPSFGAGTINNQAGAFSPATVTFSRTDQDQDLQAITVHTPPGLLGMLSKVQLCPEAQARAGTCGAPSRIGSTTVGAGPGPNPFYVGGGVYLTGPYKNAPFGLSIVVHALAGPFDLGNVIVRAAISVDPRTSALTIASDPLPRSLDGIPLQIKTVDINVDREGFTFNPTNCQALAIGATLSSTQGATMAVSSPFQAANCAVLPFKPKFTVLTNGRTSKANGAYLHVKVVSGHGQANIGRVRVDLPKQLPSRLTTLQKACVDRVFDANPASCQAASLVGSATAVTPVLNGPLRGPAYLVSHGGAAFPDLEIVLQGEGVTLVLDGHTDIRKGITSSTFDAVPDAPISTFDLLLPQGPHSVLAANLPSKARGSMCGQRLAMPTALTGQNGAVLKQTTKVAVSGCPRKRAGRRGRAGRRHTGRRRGAKAGTHR